MSMEDARLDRLLLRIEELERVLGAGDYEPQQGERTVLSRLADAERDIGDLEVHRDNREADLAWATVHKLVAHRNGYDPPAGGSLMLGYREVEALAGLIEGEWGKQT